MKAHFRADNDLIKLPAYTCAVMSGVDLPVGYVTSFKSREGVRQTHRPIRWAASSGVSEAYGLPVEDKLTEQELNMRERR